MENNKTAICIFCSNYFNSTVGEIAMKVFQKFSTFSNPTSGHRQMLKGWNIPQGGGEVVRTCWFTFIFLSKIFFWQTNSHQVEANPIVQNPLSCHLAHSFGSLCFPGCSWKNAIQRKCLPLVPDAFPFQSIWGTQKPAPPMFCTMFWLLTME